MTFSGPTSRRNWRIASRNGSDSMSPTVPPISEMTTSASLDVGDPPDALLDLVRDVRDHLHGRAEVLALPLLADDRVPDRARGVVGVSREVLVDEPLVVADVEIGLGAVLGDEDLAVLERAHRARVDVQVRVELLHLDAQAARLQEPAERGGGDPLPERRDHAAGDEDVLRRALSHGRLPSRSSSRSPGVRSIRRPIDVRSPRRLRPASTPIAAQRARPWKRSTDFNPSTAPERIRSCVPQHRPLAEIVGKQQDGHAEPGHRAGSAASEVRLQARPGFVSSWLTTFAERPTSRAPLAQRVARARRAGMPTSLRTPVVSPARRCSRKPRSGPPKTSSRTPQDAARSGDARIA